MGRYISPDPIGQTGGINVYSYALNNPVAFIDPDGRQMLFVGGRGSLIVGGGGEASVGAFVGFHEGENSDQGLFGTSFDAGLFGSAGAGAGFEASLSVEAGLVDELSGVALNANASALIFGGSAIGDPSDENLACTDGSFGDFLSTLFGGGGGSVGLGIGAPAGGSVTVTGTGTTTDLGRAIGRAVGLEASGGRHVDP